jgi:hypothetical protein
MSESRRLITRRDFVKGVGGAAVGLAVGLPVLGEVIETPPAKSRVVLVRNEQAVDDGVTNDEVLSDMLDQAVRAYFGEDDVSACWQQLVSPDDVVGIKTNEWDELRTPLALEQAIKSHVENAGVPEAKISIDDRGVLQDPIFKEATALINVRPMRWHAWSGVGSLIKNYIMFSPDPPAYHDNTCADLGALWHLPIVKGKTRLNVLVMLTPLFDGSGWHHYDPEHTWTYGGILVGVDPVAVDTLGLQIIEAKRAEFSGEPSPIRPPAHHIRFADTRHHLGTSDPNKIELIKLGWAEGALI